MTTAIYGRQSVDKKDSISIDTQIEFCRRELSPGEDTQIFRDKGYSGSNTRRPAFQRMLKGVEEGVIRRVIVYRLDRMSRSLLDFAKLIDFFDRHSTSFVSTQERFDTGTPMGRAMLSITMVFAQLERETIQARIRDNYYSRGARGMYLGGPPPFGFERSVEHLEGKKHTILVPVPDESAVVLEMYRLYGLERRTLGETARILNQSGALSPAKKLWTGSRVGLTLRNPIYVCADASIYCYYRERGCRITGEPELFAGTNGCYLYGKRERNQRKYTSTKGHVLSLAPSLGLVDSRLFLACQERLDSNRPLDNSGWGTITWLTGLMKCRRCGYAVTPKSSNNARYYYLYCSGHRTGCCDVVGNLGRVNEVEAAVEQRIIEVAQSHSRIRVPLGGQQSQEAVHIEGEIQSINNQLERLLDRLASTEEVASRYINQRIAELDWKKRSLEQQREKSMHHLCTPLQDLESFPGDWQELDARQKNRLARLFIDFIALSKDGISIHWKHRFAPQGSSEKHTGTE